MTVSSTTNRVDYTGNGATTVYPYTFKIFADSELRVTTRDTDDQETTLVLDTDYTVSGVGNSSGGNVTLTTALGSSYRLTIRRVRPLTQETDIRNNGDFYPETHEDAFDKLLMIDQQLAQDIDRSFVLPETYSASDVDTTLPIPVAERLIGWNADGDGLSNYAAAGNLAVSAFMESVLDDTTASAARTTLGLGSASAIRTLAGFGAGGLFIVAGDIAAGAVTSVKRTHATASKTSTYTATTSDEVILCDATSAAFTINLPAVASSTGLLLFIKKTDSSTNAITIDGNASETIDGATTFTLSGQNEIVSLICNGSNWQVLQWKKPSVAFSVNRNSVNQSVTNGVNTKVEFTTEAFDVGGYFDSATNYRFTPKVPGKYTLSFNALFNATVDTAITNLMIYKNGSIYTSARYHASTTKDHGGSVSCIVDANGTTDYFEAYIFQDSGSPQNLLGTPEHTNFSGALLF